MPVNNAIRSTSNSEPAPKLSISRSINLILKGGKNIPLSPLMANKVICPRERIDFLLAVSIDNKIFFTDE